MKHMPLHALLGRALHLHVKRSGSRFSRYGISNGQPRILEYLSMHNGCIQRQLARHCELEPATITSVLTLMEKSGFIYRAPSQTDKRALCVFLTEKGWQAAEQVNEVFSKLEEECFDGFTAQQRRDAIDYLTRIGDNMRKAMDLERAEGPREPRPSCHELEHHRREEEKP
ncbi:MAG: MarR family winged helix-turn-helix transcriptional regulator [Oscillospiraceae bacterium]